MAEAQRDSNYVPTLIGVSSSDQLTPTLLEVDPVTGRLLVTATVTSTSADQPSSATVTTVADTATSTTIKAANTDRKEIEIVNTSSAVLYLLKGSGTASATNFTVRLDQYDYYTTDYTGQLNGVWASDAGDGSAIVTESE